MSFHLAEVTWDRVSKAIAKVRRWEGDPEDATLVFEVIESDNGGTETGRWRDQKALGSMAPGSEESFDVELRLGEPYIGKVQVAVWIDGQDSRFELEFQRDPAPPYHMRPKDVY